MPSIEAQYRDGDIRLVGGSYQWEGRVEIYFSGTWGTITDSQWTSNDAQAVCRKMGYFKPGMYVHCYSSVIVMLNVFFYRSYTTDCCNSYCHVNCFFQELHNRLVVILEQAVIPYILMMWSALAESII